MSFPIKRIIIEGFRGILSRLDIDFVRNSQARSMIIYGANGTGKSSITDAWEWFQTDHIEHLRKEGAEHSAFCHVSSTAGSTYVEIEFSDSSLGTARLAYDHDRITQPDATGNLHSIRERCPHPCCICFGDLTRFVYLTKVRRFEQLAKLMGFVPQVEYLKALRRTERKLDSQLEQQRNTKSERIESLRTRLDLDQFDEAQLWRALSLKLAAVSIKCAPNADAVRKGAEQLRGMVTKDETTLKLSQLKRISATLNEIALPPTILETYDDYVAKAVELLGDREALSKTVLRDLYAAAETILEGSEERQRCPLCGARYDGDLYEHVKDQHRILAKLTKRDRVLTKVRTDFLKVLSNLPKTEAKLTEVGDCFTTCGMTDQWNLLVESSKAMDKLVGDVQRVVSLPIQTSDVDLPGTFKTCKDEFNRQSESSEKLRTAAVNQVAKEDRVLEADTSRTTLVDVHDQVAAVIKDWEDVVILNTVITNLEKTRTEFNRAVEDFATNCHEDVDTRFQLISQNVDKYFGILEKSTQGIKSPRLRLLETERSVVLEIEFRGRTIQPAYRYLSESQLNSFGLAVFLASVRQFNTDFKFMILDDIINSFDRYKRPQVIELLRSEFSDFQVLLLTHDEIWKDRLYRTMPDWVRKEFYDYAISTGPLIRDGVYETVRIQEQLDQGRPTEAARNLGPYLEKQLQTICENFQVMVKYSQSNEYTLEPLFNFLMSRVKKKLGNNHEFVSSLTRIWEDSGFRNFCSHWRESVSVYTKEEIQGILDNWLGLEARFYCQERDCLHVLQYDGERAFVCVCGKTRLQRDENQ